MINIGQGFHTAGLVVSSVSFLPYKRHKKYQVSWKQNKTKEELSSGDSRTDKIQINSPRQGGQKVSVVFEQSSWHVSLVVIVVAAILGTIQEVIYQQAADRRIQLHQTQLTTHHRTGTTGINRGKEGRSNDSRTDASGPVLLLFVLQFTFKQTR